MAETRCTKPHAARTPAVFCHSSNSRTRQRQMGRRCRDIFLGQQAQSAARRREPAGSRHQRSWSTQAACSYRQPDSRGRECRCDFSGGCALGNTAVQLSFAPPTDSSRRWARGAKFGRRFSFEVRRCNFIVTVLHNSSGKTAEPGMTVVGNRWLTAGCAGSSAASALRAVSRPESRAAFSHGEFEGGLVRRKVEADGPCFLRKSGRPKADWNKSRARQGGKAAARLDWGCVRDWGRSWRRGPAELRLPLSTSALAASSANDPPRRLNASRSVPQSLVFRATWSQPPLA